MQATRCADASLSFVQTMFTSPPTDKAHQRPPSPERAHAVLHAALDAVEESGANAHAVLRALSPLKHGGRPSLLFEKLEARRAAAHCTTPPTQQPSSGRQEVSSSTASPTQQAMTSTPRRHCTAAGLHSRSEPGERSPAGVQHIEASPPAATATLPLDTGLAGRLMRTQRALARVARSHQEQEQEIQLLEEENSEMHVLTERQRTQLREIPRWRRELEAAPYNEHDTTRRDKTQSHPIPSHPTAPHHTTPHCTTAHHITLHDTILPHTIPYHTIPYCTIPYHTARHHTTRHHATPQHSTSYHTSRHDTTHSHPIPYHHTTPHHITLRYITSHHMTS